MATIDELLSGSDVLSDIDEIILVDPVARSLIIPQDELVLGVAGDKYSECKYFKMPTTVGSRIAVTACNIRILFKNANGEEKYSKVKEVVSDDSTVVFCWEVPDEAVAYEGKTEFSVCLHNTTDGKEWHTTPAIGNVLRGLLCAASEEAPGTAPSVPDEGSDVVSDEQIAKAVEAYMEKHPAGGVYFEPDDTLRLEDNVLSVNTTNDMERDNTLPITSAGVFATVGNIEALLKTI